MIILRAQKITVLACLIAASMSQYTNAFYTCPIYQTYQQQDPSLWFPSFIPSASVFQAPSFATFSNCSSLFKNVFTSSKTWYGCIGLGVFAGFFYTYRQKNNEISSLKRQVEGLERAQSVFSGALSTLQQTNNELQSSNKKQDESQLLLSLELEKKQKKITEQEERLRVTQNGNLQLEQEKRELATNISILKNGNILLKETAIALEQQLECLETQKQNLEKRLSHQEQKARDLEFKKIPTPLLPQPRERNDSYKKYLQTRIENLEKTIEEKEELLIDQQSKFFALQDQKDNLQKNQLSIEKEKTKQLIKWNQTRKKSVRAWKKLATTRNVSISMLIEQEKLKEHEIKALRNHLSSLQQQITEMENNTSEALSLLDDQQSLIVKNEQTIHTLRKDFKEVKFLALPSRLTRHVLSDSNKKTFLELVYEKKAERQQLSFRKNLLLTDLNQPDKPCFLKHDDEPKNSSLTWLSLSPRTERKNIGDGE